MITLRQVVAGILLVAPVTSMAQGNVNFANIGAGFQAQMTYENQPVQGSDWVVQLYVGMDESTLAPVNAPMHFKEGASGFFLGGTMEIPGFGAGSTVPAAQVRAWNITSGMTYELSDARTESNVFSIENLGGGISLPASMSGMRTASSSAEPDPEPAPIAPEPAPEPLPPQVVAIGEEQPSLTPVAEYRSVTVIQPDGSEIEWVLPPDYWPTGSVPKVSVEPVDGDTYWVRMPGLGFPFEVTRYGPVETSEMRVPFDSSNFVILASSLEQSGGLVADGAGMPPDQSLAAVLFGGTTLSADAASFQAVPEPGSVVLFVLGLFWLSWSCHRKRGGK